MGRLLILTLFLLLCAARAEDLYVAQVTAGADDGSSCANAKSLAWLNTAGNWGSGANKVSPGDTVHLCGTFTNTLSIAGSGSVGSPVTILFETDAKFSWSAWGDNGAAAIWGNGVQHIVIDGGTNGKIESTNNGTALGLQVESVGIVGQLLTTFTVQNLTTTNMYVRTPYFTGDDTAFGMGMILSGTNLLVRNCKLSDGYGGVAFVFGAGLSQSNSIIGNTFLKVNHAITVSLAASLSYPRDIVIASNRIDQMNIYDNHTLNWFHRDGLIWLDESVTRGAASNVYVFANYIGPNNGTNPWTTALLFFNTYFDYQIDNLRIYNNVLDCSQSSFSGGGISLGGCTNSLIANNTLIDCHMQLGQSNVRLTNNLFYGTASGGYGINFGGYGGWFLTNPPSFRSDYNVFFPVPAGSGQFAFPGNRSCWWVQWTNTTADTLTTPWPDLEVHSLTNRPTLSGFAPAATDTVLRGNGANLSAVFTTDFNGNPRPATGAWTIGAFEMSVSAVSRITIGTIRAGGTR